MIIKSYNQKIPFPNTQNITLSYLLFSIPIPKLFFNDFVKDFVNSGILKCDVIDTGINFHLFAYDIKQGNTVWLQINQCYVIINCFGNKRQRIRTLRKLVYYFQEKENELFQLK